MSRDLTAKITRALRAILGLGVLCGVLASRATVAVVLAAERGGQVGTSL